MANNPTADAAVENSSMFVVESFSGTEWFQVLVLPMGNHVVERIRSLCLSDDDDMTPQPKGLH